MTKILVVDDEVNLRELMHKVLEKKGYQVTTVPSADQAHEILFKDPFDLVILDVELAGKSGITVLKTIRENNKKIPIVIYSGCITQEIETEAKTAGANEVLRKDIGVTQLAQQIEKIINVKGKISDGLFVKKERPILVVDDEENIRRLVKEFFEHKGYEVLEAENGQKAIETVRSNKVSAVLLDFQMPGMDGLETLKGLLAVNPNLGIVMATAEQDDEKVTNAIKMGAYGYVLKPFDFLYLELIVMSRLAIAES